MVHKFNHNQRSWGQEVCWNMPTHCPMEEIKVQSDTFLKSMKWKKSRERERDTLINYTASTSYCLIVTYLLLCGAQGMFASAQFSNQINYSFLQRGEQKREWKTGHEAVPLKHFLPPSQKNSIIVIRKIFWYVLKLSEKGLENGEKRERMLISQKPWALANQTLCIPEWSHFNNYLEAPLHPSYTWTVLANPAPIHEPSLWITHPIPGFSLLPGNWPSLSIALSFNILLSLGFINDPFLSPVDKLFLLTGLAAGEIETSRTIRQSFFWLTIIAH